MPKWMTLQLMSEQRNLQDSSWSTVHPEERSRERHTRLMNVCTTIHYNFYSSTEIFCNLLLQICYISEGIIEHLD